jgi:hypothetical protein
MLQEVSAVNLCLLRGTVRKFDALPRLVLGTAELNWKIEGLRIECYKAGYNSLLLWIYVRVLLSFEVPCTCRVYNERIPHPRFSVMYLKVCIVSESGEADANPS